MNPKINRYTLQGYMTRRGAGDYVAQWREAMAYDVKDDLAHAIARSGLTERPLEIPPNTSAPSLGHKMAEHFVASVWRRLGRFEIRHCRGPGYPDCRITSREGRWQPIACELKTLSHENPKDGQRIVLTSSVEKLKAEFSPPVYHLLVTLFIRRFRAQVFVKGVQLDFLDPTTRVGIRVEASVSQQMLAQGDHMTAYILADE